MRRHLGARSVVLKYTLTGIHCSDITRPSIHAPGISTQEGAVPAARIRFYFHHLLLAVCFTLLAASSAWGQSTNEGIPEHTVAVPVPLGFVSATTGHLRLEIPIASIPQRNSDPLIAKLVYDSQRFTYGLNGNAGWLNLGSGWGVIIGTAHSGTASYDSTHSSCTDSGYPIGTVYTYNNFRFIDNNGTVHQIQNSNIYTQQVDCYTTNGIKDPNTGYPSSTSGTPADNSGYTISVTNYNQMQIRSNDGWVVYDNTGANPYTPKDTNGNYLNGLSNSEPDTLGRSPITASYPPCLSQQNPPPTCTASVAVKVSASTATYTLNYTAQSVSEYFTYYNGTSNVTVTEVGTESFLTSLVLPDGSQYSFTYDTGNTPTHLGDLIGITLPTGGQVSFTHVPGDSYQVQFGGWVTSASFGGGTWNFNYVPNGSFQTITTLTEPPRYDSVSKANVSDTIVFTTVPYDPHLQTAQYYSGSSTLLKTISIAYLGGGNYLPISVTTTLGDTNQSSQVTYQYFNNWIDHVSQKQETDFSGSVVRTTKISYTGPYSKPSSFGVYAGTGTGSPISSVTYTYDEYSANYCKNGFPGLTNVTGATAHDDTNYGIGFTSRGNVTTLSRLISGGTYAVSHKCYNTLGSVTQEVDANGNPTTFDYSENWADTNCIPSGTLTHSYPTTMSDALGFRRKSKYFTCTGLRQSAADENDLRAGRAGTTYTYDALNRPLTFNNPDTGQTTMGYPNPATITTTKAMGSTNLQTTTILDGIGRTIQTQLNTDPDCSGGTKTDTTYDALGRKASVSNPYCATSDATYGITSYAYDALGRVAQVTHPDGTSATTTYLGAATKTTDEGNGTQAVQRISQSDALSRLTSVCEVSSTTLIGSGGTPSACGQSIAATGFLTTYQYDVLDNLTQVSQGTLNLRTFAYDGLSRMTSSTNPESGSTTYTYDANGNLLTKTSPAQNQTGTATVTLSYCYDALNRMTSKAYTAQSCPMTAPVATYAYDASSVDGLSLTNPVGRMVKAATADGQTATVNTYDPMGRINNQWQCTPQNCGHSYFSLPYAYDLLGNMTSSANGVGTTLTYSYNAAAHLTTVTSSLSDSNHRGTLLSGVHYNSLAAPTTASLGNGLTQSIVYTSRGSLLALSAGTASSPTTPGTGSATVSGSEQTQTKPGNPAAPGTGNVTVYGSENSTYYYPCGVSSCPTLIYDSGTVSVTVNGFTSTAYYGQNDTSSSIAANIASGFSSSNAPVTASVSANTVTLTAKTTGASTNYPLTASWTYDSSHFSGPSFQASTSGSTLTGGADATSSTTIYDSGSVWVSVNGFQASANYGQGSTTSTLASALAAVFNGSNTSPVTASSSGSSLTLTAKQSGASSNYPLSGGSSTSQPGTFSQPSFTVSVSGSALTGGGGGVYYFDLIYAGNGNILTGNDSVNGNWTYGYDALNRLASANTSGQSYTYDYDRYGNRWHQNGPHTMMLSFSGNNNRMDGYSYDAPGNLLNDAVHSYTYDAENRITQVDGGSTATYVYDANGRRVRKTTGRVSVDYLYDLDGNQITELGSKGAWNRGEVYAGGQHLATYSGGTKGTTYFNHADWLGTARARTNVSGSLYETCASLPFGDALSCSTSDVSPMHFTGQQRDSESGLDNFIARYIGSNLGRFMSPDPANVGGDLEEWDNPQSWNLYSYVGNNPINAVDPDGRDCLYITDNAAEIQRGSCTEKGGIYIAGHINEKSFVYDQDTRSLSFTYKPYDPEAQAGYRTIPGVGPSSGVTDADRFNAVVQGMQMATPAVNLAANGLRAFGYAVAGPLMVAAECLAGAPSCTKGNVAMALLPEVGALREGATLLKEGAAVGKGAEILQKGGGMAQAAKDFESLQGAEKVYGSTKVKELAGGTKAVLYESKGSGPTLALQDAAGRTVTKIRY